MSTEPAADFWFISPSGQAPVAAERRRPAETIDDDVVRPSRRHLREVHPEHVLAASSGDLGATVGNINIPAAGGRPASRTPFFTIWRRDSVRDPWRYVAE